MSAKDEDYEYDSTSESWKHYYRIYRHTILERMFDLSRPIIKDRGFVASGIMFEDEEWNKIIQDKKVEVLIGGDIVFNLSEKKCNYFKKKCDGAKELLNRIDRVKKNNYSLFNISLLLRTGNLQRIRNWSKSDYFPAFLIRLNDYFNNRENNDDYIFNGNNKNWGNIDVRKKVIKLYLSNFKDIYDYCKIIHKIEDTNIVNEALELGKVYPSNKERIEMYFGLIEKCWECKKDYMKRLKI